MLQKKEYYGLNRRERKEKIIKIYDRYIWHRGGLIEEKETQKSYKLKKSTKIFYLTKKINGSDEATEDEER